MITLRKGLEDFHLRYEAHLDRVGDATPDEVDAFFRAHDVAHVLFECDISLFGEGSVKLWTIFGTTMGFWHHLRAYREAEAFQISKRFRLSDVVRDVPRLLWSAPLIIRRARTMRRPWPWDGFSLYLDTPIFEIREEFNIRVLHGEPVSLTP